LRLLPETLARLRAGEREAFALVVAELTPMVRGIVSRFWRRPWDQEDAMQEIWAHAFRSREVIDPSRPADLPGWIAVLSHRRCVDLLRARNPAAPAPDDPGEVLAAVEQAPAQQRTAEEVALAAAVERFRAGLGPAWRLFFDAYFVKGLAYPEIAGALGITRLRCKYMRKVLAGKAMRDPTIMAAIGRAVEGDDVASDA
jgi:RNA polymerase sigma factor (sigma-70 family)